MHVWHDRAWAPVRVGRTNDSALVLVYAARGGAAAHHRGAVPHDLMRWLHRLFSLLLSRAAGGSSLPPAECAVYDKVHTGCALSPNQTLQCVDIRLVANSTGRTSPPWGKRFMYDSGGRTISAVGPTDVSGCALQCVQDGPRCLGFALLTETGMCYTVNDTVHTVATKLAAVSFNLTHKGSSCQIDCQGGDGKALAPWGLPRPVAAGGGLSQCQQYCDVADTAEPGSCAAVVYQAGASGGVCSLVNASARAVSVLVPSVTFRRRPRQFAPRGGMDGTAQLPLVEQWIVGPSDRVFEAARPWQTAFCRHEPAAVDWAAAPGTFVATQLALLVTETAHTATARVRVSDLIATAADTRIPANQVEVSQVGLVSASSCPPSVCGSRAYSAELGPGTHWCVLHSSAQLSLSVSLSVTLSASLSYTAILYGAGIPICCSRWALATRARLCCKRTEHDLFILGCASRRRRPLGCTRAPSRSTFKMGAVRAWPLHCECGR